MERHFAGVLYVKGLESAKRMTFEDSLKRAKNEGILSPDEELDFDEFHHLRNANGHFRAPSHDLSGLRRSIGRDQPFDDLVKQDALTT